MKTKPNVIKLSSFLLAGVAAVALSAFEKSEAAPDKTDPAIEAVFLDTAPKGAMSIKKLRKNVKPGETVTISGRIAGSMKPFAPEYAAMILADESLATCEKNPADSCKTPWDACCVAPEKIAASRLFVQIVGEDGRPINQTLKGVKGLTELDDVIITGTVTETSSAENVIINVTGIYPNKG